MSGAYYNEIDAFAAQWLRNLIAGGHIAPGEVDERSILDVSPADLRGFTQCHFFAGIGIWSLALRRAGWSDDRPIWTGSCPCQPFSVAGLGAGFDDERHIWPHFHHLIDQCRPGVVTGEQVASKDAAPWLDALQVDLEGVGYAVRAVAFPSAGVGAPHIRDRMYWVADAAISGRREERADARRISGGDCAERVTPGSLHGSADSRLADADGGGRQQLQSVAGHASVLAAPHGSAECFGKSGNVRASPNAELPGPINGFWRDADWLFCRDGKWRPVEPSYVKVVAGYSGGVVRVRADRSAPGPEEKVNAAPLPTLPNAAGDENIPELQRVSAEFSSPKVLQPNVHGGSVRGADKSGEPEEQPPTVRQVPCGAMRSVQQEITPCSPPRRKPDEQRPLEFAELVRFLPSSLARAQQNGDNATSETLHVLRATILSAGSLLHSSNEVEAVWSSLGEEAQDAIRLGFDAARWERVVSFPLVQSVRTAKSGIDWRTPAGTENQGHRAGRLKGYGNALNAEAATQFIGAYLDTLEAP